MRWGVQDKKSTRDATLACFNSKTMHPQASRLCLRMIQHFPWCQTGLTSSIALRNALWRFGVRSSWVTFSTWLFLKLE